MTLRPSTSSHRRNSASGKAVLRHGRRREGSAVSRVAGTKCVHRGPARVALTVLLASVASMIGSALHGAPSRAADSSAAVESFRQAAPGYDYLFPRDHGSHEAFRTEWWYYTGHLAAVNGRRFGYELTFFRRGLRREAPRPDRSRWAIDDLYLAHFALSDIDRGRFLYAEKVSRAALGKAGAVADTLDVWIDRWSAELVSQDPEAVRLSARSDGVGIDLRLASRKPPVIHGLEGISRKGGRPGQASHYYSLTRLATEGTVRVDDEDLAVTGWSWMDHEFGSADLGDDQVGWDWFSVQLDDRTELMFYLLRRRDGTPDPASSGTFVFPDGRVGHLTVQDVTVTVLDHWFSRASGARYPSRWEVVVPSLGLSLRLSPLLSNQELITGRSTQITYWEGAVTVDGTTRDEPITGHGYVELTGYAEPLDQRL